MDGTLLDSKHALTPRVEQALKAAVAKGVQIVLATGKTRYSTVKLVEQLGITAPAIYLQGLVIYDADGAICSPVDARPGAGASGHHLRRRSRLHRVGLQRRAHPRRARMISALTRASAIITKSRRKSSARCKTCSREIADQ